MQIEPKNFYTYFKECYKLDYKEYTVDNILATKHTYKWFVSDTEELLYQQLPLIPYPNKKAASLVQELNLYNLEKELFYGCCFLLGTHNNAFVKDKRICAPLFLFPASIRFEDDFYYLSIDTNAATVNRAALSLIDLKEELISKDNFTQQLLNLVAENHFIKLSSFLQTYTNNLATEELLLFPSVWSAQKIRKAYTHTPFEEGSYTVVPAAATVLVEKSGSSLQVLNDLTELSEGNTFDSGTEELLKGITSTFPAYQSYYESRLNTDQYKALTNAHQYKNSVIVGPPGTGKSYTITSIVADALTNNQSVLVVSKTKQAVEVLRHMLAKEFKLKDYLVHTSGARYKTSLTAKIKRYLSGITAKQKSVYNQYNISFLANKLATLEADFEACIQKELELSDLEFNSHPNLLEKWRKFYLKSIVYKGSQLYTYFEEMNAVLLKLEKEISKHSQEKIAANLHQNIQLYRASIALFSEALESNSFSEYKRILKTLKQEQLLKVFPLWLVNLSELNSVLPLQKESFDLVIIDEATQCNIATALPALYRAKHAVVVGDPNQLRHYSFVAAAQQHQLQQDLQLPKSPIFDYRNKSVLDLFIANMQQQGQVTFLREHFRSTPSLIEFSNTHFYDGQLEVLKATPNHIASSQLSLVQLNGVRNKQGENAVEAQAVIAKLKELMEHYAGVHKKPSIGIISPFSAQVNYLKKLLKSAFELQQLQQFDVVCGTPYQFQGSEREIILVSFCVDPQTHHSAFAHANQPEVLNVAITRAKSLQIVFTSVTANQLQDSLLGKYLQFITEFYHAAKEPPALDAFQQSVVKALEAYTYDSIQCGYPVAGSLLDILITHKGNNYFIDLIGYPGIFKETFTLERYKTLERTGIKTFPLHYSFWQKHPQEALQRMRNFIK